MIKRKVCKKCNSEYSLEKICDTCGKKLNGIDDLILNIDSEDYDFCNYTCLLQFIVQEIKKTQPKEYRFEYGKEK
jgi:hypothetical protein